MKKYLLLVLALVLSLSLLVACGGGEEAPPADTDAPAADDAAEDAPAEVAGTVVMPVSGVEVDKAAMPAEELEINLISTRMGIIEAYEAEMMKLDGFENYKINFVYDQNAMQTQSMAMSAGGGENSYQLMSVSASNFGVFNSNGWLYDLTPFIEKYGELYNLDDIPQSVWDTVTVDGKILGIPTTVNMLQMFYRSDILEEEGLAVPTTFDELITTLDALVAAGYETPYVTAFGVPYGLEIEFMNMMFALGGEFFDPATNMPLFNSPEGVEALERLDTLYGYMNPDALTWASDDLTVSFQTGGAVIAQTWSTRSANMEDPTVSQIAGLVGYAPSVSVVEGNPLYSYIANDYFVIPHNIGDEALAEAAFLAAMEAICEPAQQAAATVSMVTRASSLTEENIASAPAYPSMLESMELGLRPYVSIEFPFFGQVTTLMGPYLTEALANDGVTYEEQLQKIEEETIILLQDLGYIE